MTDDLTLAAKERRRTNRLAFWGVVAYVLTALMFLAALGVVADRLDKSNDLARQQRCSFALQGQWNRAIVNYLDAVTGAASPEDRAAIRRNLNLIAEQQSQRSVCP